MVVHCQQRNGHTVWEVAVLRTCRGFIHGFSRVSAVSYCCKLTAQTGGEGDHWESGNHGLPFMSLKIKLQCGIWGE